MNFVKVDSTEHYLVPTPIYPCQAIVLYDFEKENEDEMSVRKDEKIFIESKPEHDGWLIAKGRERSGLVPESYVKLLPSPVPSPEPSLFLIFSSILFSLFIELRKNSGAGVTKSKSFRKKNKSTSDATVLSSSSKVVDNEADDFSDD